MKPFKVITSLVIMTFFTGCSSNWIQKDNENRRGIISYLTDGAGFVVEGRRKNALEKMEEFCQGGYEIVRENSGSNYGGTYASASGNTAMAIPMYQNYSYLFFECR